MLFCTNCGASLTSKDKFCPKCGYRKENKMTHWPKWGKYDLGDKVKPTSIAFLPGIPEKAIGKVVEKSGFRNKGDDGKEHLHVIYTVEFVVRKIVPMRAHESEIELAEQPPK